MSLAWYNQESQDAGSKVLPGCDAGGRSAEIDNRGRLTASTVQVRQPSCQADVYRLIGKKDTVRAKVKNQAVAFKSFFCSTLYLCSLKKKSFSEV